MFQRQTSYCKEQDTRVNPFPLPTPARNVIKSSTNPITSEGRQTTHGNQANQANPASPSSRDESNKSFLISSPTQSSPGSSQRSWNTVLTTRSQMFSARPRANTSTSKHSRTYKSMDAGSSLPRDLPPSYNNIPIPDVAITYAFSQVGSTNAMLVVPRQGSGDTAPRYYISVGYEPFLPTCMVTSIYRGPNDQGVYVGAFHTTLLQSNSSGQAMSIRGLEGRQSDVFKPASKKKGNQIFDWGDGNTVPRLQWMCPGWPAAGTFTCRDPLNNHVYAEYSVPSRRLEPREKPSITVLPIGHSVFDDLVFSIMLLERRRLSSLSSDSALHNPLIKKNL